MSKNERREYRDYTPEILTNHALLGAVLRQAYEDVGNAKFNRDRFRNTDNPTPNAEREYHASNAACSFFNSHRLKYYCYILGLNPDYMKRKYKEKLKESYNDSINNRNN